MYRRIQEHEEKSGYLDTRAMQHHLEGSLSWIEIEIRDIEEVNYILRNIVRSTPVEAMLSSCSYRKCYNDGEPTSISLLYLPGNHKYNEPSFLCDECMVSLKYVKDKSELSNLKTLADIIEFELQRDRW